MNVVREARVLVDIVNVGNPGEGAMVFRVGSDQAPPPLCIRDNPDNPGGIGLVVNGGTIHRRITPDFWSDLDRALGKVHESPEPPDMAVAQQNLDDMRMELGDRNIQLKKARAHIERLEKQHADLCHFLGREDQ